MVAFYGARPFSVTHTKPQTSQRQYWMPGKRGDRPASLHARCQADGSARSPESWRQETMFVAIHRAMAYVPLKLGALIRLRGGGGSLV